MNKIPLKAFSSLLILACLCSCSGEASTSVPSSVQPVSASSAPSSIAAIQGDSSSTSMPETGSSSSQIWQEEEPDLSYDEYFSEERKVEHIEGRGLPSADTTSKFGVNYLSGDEKIIYYRDTIKSLTPNAVTNYYFAKNRYLYYAEKGKGLYVYDDKTQEHEFVFEFGGNVMSFCGDDKAVYFLDADTYMVYRLYRPTSTVDEMCIIPEEDRGESFCRSICAYSNFAFAWKVDIPGDYTGRSGDYRLPMYDSRTKTIGEPPLDYTYWLY